MEYRKFGQDYVVRMQKGEEILSDITAVCEKEHIILGTVQGIGAVGEVTLGVFSREQFKYLSQEYKGDFEIASCSGNISTMAGKTYLHVHMVVGNVAKQKFYAGHLNKGVISLTGEFILHKIEGSVEREYSPEVGLNLFKFN
jgi:predicted DNA-binding protein with PD1-like motif